MDMLSACYDQDGVAVEAMYRFLKETKLPETQRPTDLFFTTKILVTPPRHRPINVIAGRHVESELTALYKVT